MPIIALLIYIVLTFCPIIYKYLPFLGTIKTVLIAGIVLLISFLLTYTNYANSTAYKHTVIPCWAVILVVMTLGLLVSVDRGLTLELVQSSLKVFLIFLVMIKIVDSVKRLQIILLAFVLSGIGMAGSTLFNYFVNPDSLRTAEAANLSGGYRAIALESGVFGDPNDLALLFNTVLPFAIYLLLINKQKVVPLLGISILVIAIVLTHSRAGFLGLCVTALGFLMIFRKSHGKHILVICVLAASLFVVAPDSYKERIGTLYSSEEGQTIEEGRINGWLIAIKEGMSHPVLGVGAGGSMYVNLETAKDWHAVHNTFAQVFVEMGAFGFAAYLMLFITSLRQSQKKNEGSSEQVKSFSKSLAVAFVTYGTTAFFTPQAYSSLLFILTALTVITSELMKKEYVPVSSPRTPGVLRTAGVNTRELLVHQKMPIDPSR